MVTAGGTGERHLCDLKTTINPLLPQITDRQPGKAPQGHGLGHGANVR